MIIFKKLLALLRPKQPKKVKKPDLTLRGYAVVEKDDISGKHRWVTYDAADTDRDVMGPGDPLIIHPNNLAVGCEFHMFERIS
jgi:hypothetical protein